MLQHNRRIAHQSLQTPFGTTATETANSRRLGVVLRGVQQATLQPTIQLPELAGTNVQTATTLKTVERVVFPIQKQELPAQDCR